MPSAVITEEETVVVQLVIRIPNKTRDRIDMEPYQVWSIIALGRQRIEGSPPDHGRQIEGQ